MILDSGDGALGGDGFAGEQAANDSEDMLERRQRFPVIDAQPLDRCGEACADAERRVCGRRALRDPQIDTASGRRRKGSSYAWN
jgi:hypothetical protein